jgi:hypothetical protein
MVELNGVLFAKNPAYRPAEEKPAFAGLFY